MEFIQKTPKYQFVVFDGETYCAISEGKAKRKLNQKVVLQSPIYSSKTFNIYEHINHMKTPLIQNEKSIYTSQTTSRKIEERFELSKYLKEDIKKIIEIQKKFKERLIVKEEKVVKIQANIRRFFLRKKIYQTIENYYKKEEKRSINENIRERKIEKKYEINEKKHWNFKNIKFGELTQK